MKRLNLCVLYMIVVGLGSAASKQDTENIEEDYITNETIENNTHPLENGDNNGKTIPPDEVKGFQLEIGNNTELPKNTLPTKAVNNGLTQPTAGNNKTTQKPYIVTAHPPDSGNDNINTTETDNKATQKPDLVNFTLPVSGNERKDQTQSTQSAERIDNITQNGNKNKATQQPDLVNFTLPVSGNERKDQTQSPERIDNKTQSGNNNKATQQPDVSKQITQETGNVNEVPKPDDVHHEIPNNKDSNLSEQKSYTPEVDSPSSGHFMGYLLTAIILCVAGYVVFHNKQKIIAFIVEGRSGRQRRRTSNGVEYKKLQSNVEEVMPSLDKSAASKHFIY